MKVGEFIAGAKGYEDCELTIRKHDKGQLTSNTTVPVKAVHIGFDWTHNQLVLEPEVELQTSQATVERRIKDQLVQEYERNTNHMRLAAKLARMIQEIPDEGLRNRIHDVLKQF